MRLLIVALIVGLLAFGCMAKPNKFCQFEAFGVKKCIQLSPELTEQKCFDLGGLPAPDCGSNK